MLKPIAPSMAKGQGRAHLVKLEVHLAGLDGCCIALREPVLAVFGLGASGTLSCAPSPRQCTPQHTLRCSEERLEQQQPPT